MYKCSPQRISTSVSNMCNLHSSAVFANVVKDKQLNTYVGKQFSLLQTQSKFIVFSLHFLVSASLVLFSMYYTSSLLVPPLLRWKLAHFLLPVLLHGFFMGCSNVRIVPALTWILHGLQLSQTVLCHGTYLASHIPSIVHLHIFFSSSSSPDVYFHTSCTFPFVHTHLSCSFLFLFISSYISCLQWLLSFLKCLNKSGISSSD